MALQLLDMRPTPEVASSLAEHVRLHAANFTAEQRQLLHRSFEQLDMALPTEVHAADVNASGRGSSSGDIDDDSFSSPSSSNGGGDGAPDWSSNGSSKSNGHGQTRTVPRQPSTPGRASSRALAADGQSEGRPSTRSPIDPGQNYAATNSGASVVGHQPASSSHSSEAPSNIGRAGIGLSTSSTDPPSSGSAGRQTNGNNMAQLTEIAPALR